MLTLELAHPSITDSVPAPQRMTPDIVAAIDDDRYPFILSCMHCEGRKGDEEEVWTGERGEDNKSGFAVRFICRACREAGRPCETLHPIRLRPGTLVWY